MISSKGNRIWPLDMRPKDVDIEDIANSLSKICRFGGHCRDFYSVAQHSVIVAMRCHPYNRLVGLLHDAPEAYCGDVVRPLKQDLVGFDGIESSIWAAIATRFALPVELPREVLVEDARVLLMEKRDLLVPHEHAWEFPQCAFPDLSVPPQRIVPLGHREARDMFMRLYESSESRSPDA
jgi:uncharacterized protein